MPVQFPHNFTLLFRRPGQLRLKYVSALIVGFFIHPPPVLRHYRIPEGVIDCLAVVVAIPIIGEETVVRAAIAFSERRSLVGYVQLRILALIR